MNENFVSPFPFAPSSAVSYIRVSTSRQADRGGVPDGFSIPAQREANRRQAHALGALIVAEFVERGQSGRHTNRPELQRMLAYLQQHFVDYVIVHKIDRLARSRADDVAITKAVQESGARLVSSTENIDSTPNGALLHGVMAAIAEFYSRNLAQEVMKGLRQKVLQGGTPSYAPLGYLNIRIQTEDGREFRTVTVDPARSPHVIWPFEAYASGEWSVVQLVTELEKRGLRTRSTPSRSSAPVTTTSLHRILKNPYYTGIVTLNGVQHVGAHEPLISTAIWENVQHLLSTRRTGERTRIHTHYLKSTIFCFECGRRLLVHNARSKTGRIYSYFICSGRQNGNPRCRQRALPMARTEHQLEDAYATIEVSTRRRDEVEEQYRHRFQTDEAQRERQRTHLQEQRQELLRRQDKLLELHYSEGIPREVLQREQRRLNSALAQVDSELGRVSEDLDDHMSHVSAVLDLLEGARARYLAADPLGRLTRYTLFTRHEATARA